MNANNEQSDVNTQPLFQRTYPLIRQLLFKLPAETSHTLALRLLKLTAQCGLSSLCRVRGLHAPVETLGLTLPNPVGLAAGLDKNGDYIDSLGLLGFGFIEVGTVTPRAQPGNPKPRLFRLAQQEAIINRMGFNNKGIDHLVNQVRQSRYRAAGGIVGINIGKNVDTPLEKAESDYLYCLERAYPVADYIVVNISSPNTPGLRNLQFGEQLGTLLHALKERQTQLQQTSARSVPLVVKIAPDMDAAEIQQVAQQLLSHEIEGVIATNTTSSRAGVEASPDGNQAGGLSGKPLTEKSTQVLQQLAEQVGDRMTVIGVGGIMRGRDAAAKFEAGASLVQLYSGFIYSGSQLVTEAVNAYKGLPLKRSQQA